MGTLRSWGVMRATVRDWLTEFTAASLASLEPPPAASGTSTLPPWRLHLTSTEMAGLAGRPVAGNASRSGMRRVGWVEQRETHRLEPASGTTSDRRWRCGDSVRRDAMGFALLNPSYAPHTAP